MKFFENIIKNKKNIIIIVLYLVSIIPTIFIIKKADCQNSENFLISNLNSDDSSKNNSENAATQETTDANENKQITEPTENSSSSSTNNSGTSSNINSGTKKKSSGSSSTANNSSSSGSSNYSYLPSPAPVSYGHNVVGYYMSWSRYKGFTPENINASKLTHINYAFANIRSDLSIALADESIDLQNFESLRNLKSKNKNLRTLISIGGWDYSKYFSDAALNDTNRNLFAQNCLNFVLKYGFDGIDIDWEYPVSGGMSTNIYRTADKQNYTLLLKTLKAKLNEQKNKDGRNYYLTAAGGTSNWYLNKIECSKITAYLDHIFIMAYDLNGPWSSYANFNAPLYNRADLPTDGGDVSGGASAYLSYGIPASKIVLGMPFYGYQYTVVNNNNNGLGCKFSGASSITYDDVVSKYLNNSNYACFFDETAKVPYIFGNNTFVSYEDDRSITAKANFAKSKGFSGIGAWELSFDKTAKLLSVMSSIFK